jgi:hypothetical protein
MQAIRQVNTMERKGKISKKIKKYDHYDKLQG